MDSLIGKGQETEELILVAHLVVGATATLGLRKFSAKNFVDSGVHANLFVHGLIGALHYQKYMCLGLCPIFEVTRKAVRYLPLACILTQLNTKQPTKRTTPSFTKKEDTSLLQPMQILHLVSGVLPFALHVIGEANPQMGNMFVLINIVALWHNSYDTGRRYGWLAGGAALVAYFGSKCTCGYRVSVFTLGLAVMDFMVLCLMKEESDKAAEKAKKPIR